MSKSVNAKDWSLYVWTDGSSHSNAQPASPTIGFPRTAIDIIGGDQNGNQMLPPVPYAGQVSGHQISSSGYFPISSYDNNPAAWAGRFDMAVIGGDWEGADSNSTYDRALMVDAIKQICGKQTPFQASWVFENVMMEAIPNSVQQFDGALTNQVNASNWWLYTGANQSGGTINTYGSYYETDWCVAWPGSAYGVAADTAFNPNFTTAHYNGQAEDYPQFAGAYFSDVFFIRQSSISTVMDGTIPAASYEDPRFHPLSSGYSNNDANKAPNLDGLHTDNIFAVPYFTGYYSLKSQDSAYALNSEASPWLVRGYYHAHKRFVDIMKAAYPMRTYMPCGNLATWAQVWVSQGQTGFNAMSNGLSNFMPAGELEGVIGASWSVETNYGTVSSVHAYQAIIDFLISPKLLIFMGYISGATDYQNMRYILCCALMADGYCCVNDGTYKTSHAWWFDEYGGNPGTNIPKWWLGQRNGSRPTSGGINGVWVADFQHGTALMNPKGNGAQTVTASQINSYLGTSYSLKFFKGVQNQSLNSGLSMTSVTLQAADGVLLMH